MVSEIPLGDKVLTMNTMLYNKIQVAKEHISKKDYDEAYRGLSSRAAMSQINKLIVSVMMEMRQKNLVAIIVLPTFFMLDRYVAIFRSKGLFHVYQNKGKRGYWLFYNENEKKLLYILGHKLMSY